MTRQPASGFLLATLRPGLASRPLFKLFLGLSLVIICGLSAAWKPSAAEAQPLDPSRLPPQLLPWIDWIYDAQPEYRCVFESSMVRCEWPSELSLELGDREGRFSFGIETLRRAAIPLPGDTRLYPEALRVNGAPAPILARGGVPTVQLPAGRHRVEGRFVYQELPETLNIPRLFGIVKLRRGGEEIPTPRRAESGAIWLEGRERESVDQERLSVEIFRKIEDGNKLNVHTILLLDVGGRARRVELPRVLLEGATPYAIEAGLPVRLETDGRLSVQLSSGRHRVEIRSRLEGDLDTLRRPAHEAPLPSEEYWVIAADESFRQLRLEGAPQIDPARVNLPDELRGLPTYRLTPEDSLTLHTERRGVESRPRNELHLIRTLYLDQDGGGYSVRDQLSGALRDGHRLDLLRGELGSVRVGDEAKLLTEYEGRRGIELREEQIALVADSRLEGGRGLIPAVGWSEDLRSLSASLELPPGYLLLGGSGADRIGGAFTDRFDLGAIFMIVIISIIVSRLAGPIPGALSLLSLVLIWEEPYAPSFLFLFLLFFIALVPELPDGRAKRLIRLGLGAAVLAFFLTAMPFAKEQLKRAIYPQTEHIAYDFWASRPALAPRFDAHQAEEMALAPPEYAYDMDESEVSEQSAPAPSTMDLRSRSSSLAGSAAVKKRSARAPVAQDPESVVQMGEGIPEFSFRSHSIRWDGPVSADQELRLIILSPPLYRLLAVFRILALLTLGLAFFRAFRRERRLIGGQNTKPGGGLGAASSAIITLILSLGALSGLASPSAVEAQPIPDKELLNELRGRLLRAPECGDHCAETSLASFSIADGALSARLIVNAGAATSYRLPGPAKNYVPAEIRVNGRAHEGVLLGEDGFLRLRLQPGVHTIELRGRLADPNGLELNLGQLPHQLPRRAEVSAEGYQVQGLRDDGKVAEILRFDREIGEDEGEVLGRSDEALGFYLEIERRVELGVINQVITRVRRISPTGSAIQLRLPLLKGEDLLSENVKQSGESAEIVLSRDERTLELHSRLPKLDAIELKAAEGASYQERWIIDCDETIVCETEGLRPIALQDGERLAPSFRPLPGESLSLKVDRPDAAEGRALTVDKVELQFTPGARIAHSALTLSIRASRAETLTIRLPAEAKISRLVVGEKEQPVNFADGALSIRVEPGARDLTLEFEESRELGFRQALPNIDLGVPAVNITTIVNMPDGRFILGTQGPSWGPAVLFWGKLALILLFAFIVSRIPLSPLRFHHYAILGLGLSSASVGSSVIVLAFFFAVAYRERSPELSRRLFNLRQVGLLFLTFMTVSVFFDAIHHGLLGIPDMQVEGNNSSDRVLRFYQDRADGSLPDVAFFSTKIIVYRLLMLAWALYIAFASVRWARWAFNAYREGGFWQVKPTPGPLNPSPAGSRGPSPERPAGAAKPEPTTPEPYPQDEGADPEPQGGADPGPDQT